MLASSKATFTPNSFDLLIDSKFTSRHLFLQNSDSFALIIRRRGQSGVIPDKPNHDTGDLILRFRRKSLDRL